MIKNDNNLINVLLMVIDILIQDNFIGMKDHNDTLLNGIHTLELIMN